MAAVYLIRHGQAGSRRDYDRLSDRGREQARLLGEYLRAAGPRFDLAISGSMERQRDTAALALPGADVQVDEGWNEFDIFGLFEELAPKLAAADAAFAEEYAAIAGRPERREWTRCDLLVVRAWIAGTHQTRSESWREFRARIERRMAALPDSGAVAVFTSATPIGVAVGGCVEAGERHMMRLAGAVANTSISVIHAGVEGARLLQFNATPHLPAEMATVL